MGILSNLIQQRFGIRTRNIENPIAAAVGLAPILILPNDPDRVGFVIVNLSANILYISPLEDLTAAAAIRIEANGGWRSFTWDVDFELVSHAWFGLATGAASAIFITANIGVQ